MNESELPLTVVPRDADHLDELIVEAIVARWNAPPIERSNGVVAMRFLTIDLLISSDFDPPLIEVTGALVVEIADIEAAHFNANVLNTAFPSLKFAIEDASLLVKTHVHAMPLVPDHLFIALSSLTDLSRDLGERLVETFAGRPAR